LLQKYLKNELGIDAFVFDDLPDRGRTIIEQLEFIKDKVWYAFVIATADDLGCLNTGSKAENIGVHKKRARQNVVFELGLFIGTLGRENVCCLLQEDVEEIPSDIKGILYKSFSKSVEEKFHEISKEISDRNE
jgi:predicted nucleotide-binding protein